ncbi:unnamed protein product, partial [Mesorhabditis belari]|uniref:PCI domain-containing protein n=1 Tax=Mesorhabditis belari TaxID=2138241 RepID=A0AAF3F201_9BILA
MCKRTYPSHLRFFSGARSKMELVINTVEEAIAAPARVGYGELLQDEKVRALEKEKPELWHMLNVLAYSTYADLLPSTSLSNEATMKMQQLTILSMAAKERQIPFDRLLSALKLDTDRAVEDLIIDAMYKGLLKGRLNSMNRCFDVEEWQPRDFPLENLPAVRQLISTYFLAFYACLNNVEHVVSECNKMAAIEENNAFVQNAEEKARKKRIANARKEVEEGMRSVINLPGFLGGMGGGRPHLGMSSTSVQKEKRKILRKINIFK